MENAIRINANNYKLYAPIDPVAYSFAEPGACGSGGEIIIISNDGMSFCLNFVRGDMNKEQIEELCPIITSTEFYLFGQGDTPPAGWIPIYLGLGNHLCISEDYFPQFSEEAKGRGIVSRGHLYQQWVDIMQTIIPAKKILETKASREDDNCSSNHSNFETVAENCHVMFEGGYTVSDLMEKGHGQV